MGKWLDRAKKRETPSQGGYKTYETGFVGFVATPPEPFPEKGNAAEKPPTPQPTTLQNLRNHREAANDPAPDAPSPVVAVVADGALRDASPACARVREAEVDASLATALDTRPAVTLPEPMAGWEIERFAARVQRFASRGLALADAEALADKLVLRDQEGDTRRLCLECAACTPAQACGTPREAGLWIGLGRLPLGPLAKLPQRCPAFKEVTA